MRYLCLIYESEQVIQSLPPDEMKSRFQGYYAFTEDIRQSGHYVTGNPLQPTATAATVRVRDGQISTTTGPFAETTEQLGGYYLIEAKDLNDAIQVASKIPGAKYGSIEVRPIMQM